MNSPGDNQQSKPLEAETAELTNVAVVAMAAAGVIVSVNAADVLAVKLESPP